MLRGILLLSVCNTLLFAESHLPPYLTPCPYGDPDINTCIKNAVYTLQPHFGKGISEMAIPPMDPLEIPRVELTTGESFNLTFTDIKLNHIDKFSIDDVNVDFAKDHLDLKLTFPTIEALCQYDVKGKILVLQLEGHGPASLNASNVHGDVSLDFEKYMKNGKEYMKIKDLSLEVDLGAPQIKFDKLFPDEQLNEQTNKIVNDNIVEILKDLNPAVNSAIMQFCRGVIDKILEKFPYNELFP